MPSGRLVISSLPASPSKKAAAASQNKRNSSLEPDAQRDLTPVSPTRTSTLSKRFASVNFHTDVYDTALALQRLKTPIDMSAALHSAKPSAGAGASRSRLLQCHSRRAAAATSSPGAPL